MYKRQLLWAAAYKLRLPQNESKVRSLVFTAFEGRSAEEVDLSLIHIFKRVVAFHDLTHTSDGSAPCPFGAASSVPRDPEGGDAPCA